ncbi:hypothetical protein GCWU000324_00476 [Kingella oralis ATCC 51147]|uniref:Uncharacterized protein n=1 Tax=Kingella oralis ATCC 51147 TaxID=629741 RepID=C4GHY8_9NEIS|nr:hypothetical protein GCWU000324_00476 [Kingella oralis ATCC 51147]
MNTAYPKANKRRKGSLKTDECRSGCPSRFPRPIHNGWHTARHTFQAARNQSGSLKNGCTVNLSYIKAKRVI